MTLQEAAINTLYGGGIILGMIGVLFYVVAFCCALSGDCDIPDKGRLVILCPVLLGIFFLIGTCARDEARQAKIVKEVDALSKKESRDANNNANHSY